MRFFKWVLFSCWASCFLCSCDTTPDQTNYSDREVGQNVELQYGTVKSVKTVHVTASDSTVGTAGGAVAGGVMGDAVGTALGGTTGIGSAIGFVGGAVGGGFAGSAAQHSLQDKDALQYIIKLDNKKIVSVVQNISEKEKTFKKGDRVMVQTNGSYQRVLAAEE